MNETVLNCNQLMAHYYFGMYTLCNRDIFVALIKTGIPCHAGPALTKLINYEGDLLHRPELGGIATCNPHPLSIKLI